MQDDKVKVYLLTFLTWGNMDDSGKEQLDLDVKLEKKALLAALLPWDVASRKAVVKATICVAGVNSHTGCRINCIGMAKFPLTPQSFCK